MFRSTKAWRVLGVTATATLALAACGSSGSSSSSSGGALSAVSKCGSGQDSSNTFALGSFLPLTGSLAFLGPPADAGVGAALSDVNAAGGVNGKDACVVPQDSSDGDHKAVGDSDVKALLQAKVSAIVGPESPSVTHNILPVTNPTGTIDFSMAATDDALTAPDAIASDSAHFYRNVAPNFAEGDALGKQILSDVPGAKVGVLVFNDAYGLNLRDTLAKTLKAGGGSVVFGDTGKGQEFPSTETNFGTIVNSVLATQPDVIAIIAFDQTSQVLSALGSANYAGKKLYFVDGNLSDYSKDAGIPDLTGSHGTQQGVYPDAAFQSKLDAWYTKNDGKGKDLGGIFNYAAEGYDSVITLALAADLSGKYDSAAIGPNIGKVTGLDGGTVCKTYADCLKLIKGGATSIHYEGPSSIGPIGATHDPETAYVGIYQGVGKNTAAKFLTAVQATISTK